MKGMSLKRSFEEAIGEDLGSDTKLEWERARKQDDSERVEKQYWV